MITRAKLQRLSEDCERLLYFSEKLEGNDAGEISECNLKIKQALRKIVIANEISDRMVVCVTGLQGMGKTTLMKNFFALDDDVMNIATGRGERLPLFITETEGITEIEMYTVGLEKQEEGYDTVKKKVSSEEFVEASKGEEEDTAIMYVELLVPQRYTSDGDRISFMVLPGYEGKRDYWDKLVEFSVECSNTAVFVVDPRKISTEENESFMKKFQKKFGADLVYAITFTDTEDEKGKKELKTSLAQMLGLSAGEENRIVCTGASPEPEKNKIWGRELCAALGVQYGVKQDYVEQKNRQYIGDIITNELKPIIAKILGVATDRTEEIIDKMQHEEWLEEFDKAVTSMRKFYVKSLDSRFKAAQAEDIKALRETLAKEEWLEKLFRSVKRLFGKDAKDIQKLYQVIEESMREVDGSFRYKHAFATAIAECTSRLCVGQLAVKKAEQMSLITPQEKTTSFLAIQKEEDTRRLLLDVSEVLANEPRKKELNSNDVINLMRAVVDCGTQYLGLAVTNSLYSEHCITEPELAASGLNAAVLTQSMQTSEKFVLGVLGIMGLDVAHDGKLNLVDKLATILSVSKSTATGLAAGILGAGAAIAVGKDCNEMQLADYYAAQKVIISTYEEIKKEYIDIFNTYMEKLRDKVKQYLNHCKGINTRIMDKQNTIITIRNIKADLDEIGIEIKKGAYEFKGFITE